MAFFNILMIGIGSGIVCAIISMILINASNSQQYPLGGFFPALWMVNDLDVGSQLVEGGLLMMSGMLGFHLMLTFWTERPDLLQNLMGDHGHDGHDDHHAPVETKAVEQPVQIVSGKSLAEFL